MRSFSAVLAVLLLTACGDAGGVGGGGHVNPTPRRTIVWVDADGLDEGSAARLSQVGVDEVVVRRGSVRLTGGAPALRLNRAPAIAGNLPVGVALLVEDLAAEVDRSMAVAMWGALAGELRGIDLAELILDLPKAPPGTGAFLKQLSEVAGVPVVPILSIEQLHSGMASELVGAVQECIVPVYGSEGADLRGVGERPTLELSERLQPLAEAGLRVRVAIVLRPRCEPEVGRWGESFDRLCEPELTEVSTSSQLDWTFVFRKATQWSGRRFSEGDRLAIRWVDAARLHFCLREIGRLVLPEVAGWDLVPIPPVAGAMGMNRESLIEYLKGKGPAPQMDVSVERRGRDLRVKMVNRSPFASAVSNFGNWFEVSVPEGSLVAQERGSFDRVILGSRRSGSWQPSTASGMDAARFIETYFGPRDEVASGLIRLPSRKSRATIRWQVVLTTGEEIAGELVR